MTASDVIQIVLMGLLVVVTGIYAWRTFAIARPYLLLRLAKGTVQWNGIDPNERPLGEFEVAVKNVGKGPAINVLLGLWHPVEPHHLSSKGYLATGEEWQETIEKDYIREYNEEDKLELAKAWLPKLKEIVKQDYPGVIAVEYQDIHKRTWVSYLYLVKITGLEAYVAEWEQAIVELKKDD